MAPASEAKYCNTYDAGVAFATSPANLVDGNVATFASATSVGDIQENYFTTGQLFAIPAGSTIDGIVVQVQHYEGAAGDRLEVQLCKAGTPTGTQTALTYRTSTTLDTLGSTSDKWGTTWTAAEINASGTSGFGVELTYTDSGKNVAVYASYVVVTVHYTTPTTYSVVCAETLRVDDGFFGIDNGRDFVFVFKPKTPPDITPRYSISRYDADWATAHDSGSSDALTSTYHRVAAHYASDSFEYGCSRSPMLFDTSKIPSGHTVVAASLHLYHASNSNAGAHSFGIQHDASDTSPTDPPIQSDFNYTLYTVTDGTSQDFETGDPVGYCATALGSSGLSWIKKGTSALTRWMLRCDMDIADEEPVDETNEVYLNFRRRPDGSHLSPYLMVSTSAPSMVSAVCSEAITFTHSTAKKSAKKVCRETPTFADTPRKGFRKRVGEILSFSSAVGYVKSGHLSMTEALSLNDVIVRSMRRSMRETFKLVDALTMRTLKILSLSEAIGFLGSASAWVGLLRKVSLYEWVKVRTQPQRSLGLWNGLIWGVDSETSVAGDSSSHSDLVGDGTTHKLTQTSAASYVGGRWGRASMCATPLSAYIANSDQEKFDLTDEITVAIWIANNSTAFLYNMASIIGKKGVVDGNYPWLLGTETTRCPFFHVNSHTTGVKVTWGSAPTPNYSTVATTWGGAYHLLVGVYSKSEGKVKISVDGGTFVTADYSADMALTDNLIALPAYGYSAHGLDDVMIWDRALSQAEVTELYNLSGSLVWAGRVPHLRLFKRVSEALELGNFISGMPRLWEKVLTEALSIANSTKKHFFKLLGLEMPYTLWDSLVWASDMETSAGGDDLLDVSRNSDTYKATPGTVGVPVPETGKFGDAMRLSKVHPYTFYTIANSESATSVVKPSSITMAGWFKADKVPTTDSTKSFTLMGVMNGVYLYVYMAYSVVDGYCTVASPFVVIYNSGGADSFSLLPESITAEEWHFLAMTYDETTGMCSVFMDGTFNQRVHVEGPGAIAWPATALCVGAFAEFPLGVGNGPLDDQMIFNRALSEDELMLLYKAPRGLNLNQLTDDKMSYGPGVSDRLSKKLSRVTSEGLTLTDRLKKGLVRTLRQTLAFVDAGVVTSSVGGLLSVALDETIAFTFALSKRARKTITQTFAANDRLVKSMARRLSQTFTSVDRIGKHFRKFVSQTFTASDRFVKSISMVRRLTAGFSDVLNTSKVSILFQSIAETLALVDISRKHFRKLLGTGMPYTLWDSLIWASDMETFNGADLVDCSRNSITYKGVLTGTSNATGKFGDCREFTSVDDKMVASGSIALLQTCTSWTVAFWAKPAVYGSNRYAVHNVDAVASYDFYTYLSATGDFTGSVVTSAGTHSKTLSSAYSNGEWSLFSLGYDPVNEIVFVYCDGTYDTVAATGNMVWDEGNLAAGKYGVAPSGMVGSVDDVMFFKKALSQAELDLLYRAGRGLNLNQLNNGKMTYGPGITDQLSKSSFFRRRFSEAVRFVETCTATHVSFFQVALDEAIQFAHATVKGLAKKLGPSHLYSLWDSVLWASDGETDAGGTDLLDCSRNGTTYKVTLNAGMTPGGVPDGKYGAATYYDHDNSDEGIIDSSNTAMFEVGSISVAVWYRGDYYTGNTESLVVKLAGIETVWALRVNHAQVIFSVDLASGGSANPTKTVSTFDGEWHLAVGTYDLSLGKARISVDGSVYTDIDGVGGLTAGSGLIYIGSNAGGAYFFEGDIDDTIIFNKALSESEVAALYSARKGLNLNQLDADKAFWGPSFSETLTASRLIGAIIISEAIRFVEGVARKKLSKVVRSTLKFYDASVSTVVRGLRTQVLGEALILVDRLTKRSKRIFRETLSITHATAKKSLRRRVYETLRLTDSLKSVSRLVRRFSEQLNVDEVVSRRLTIVKKLAETIALRTRPFPNYRVAYYDMETLRSTKIKNLDEEQTITDATNYGATTDTGKVGGCYYFDGTDYMEIADHADLEPPTQVTVAGWVKTDGSAFTHEPILAKMTGTPFGYYLRLRFGLVAFMVGNGTTYGDRWAGPDLRDGEWHFVAGVYNGATITVYYDGVASTSVAWTDPIAYEDGVARIGRGGTSYDDTAYFHGDIDEVQVFKKGLTASEIIRLYLGRVQVASFDEALVLIDRVRKTPGIRVVDTVSLSVGILRRFLARRIRDTLAFRTKPYPNGRVAYYDMETLRSSKLANIDSELTAEDGTITGGVTTDPDGVVGSCQHFDGSSGYVLAADSGDNSPSGEVTVSCWANFDAKVNNAGLVWKGGYNYILYGPEGDDIKFICWDPSDVASSASFLVTLINTGEWHHIVGVYRSSDAKSRIFLDGAPVGVVGGANGGSIRDTSGGLYFGVRGDFGGTPYFDGKIDEVQVFKRGLTDGEVLRLYLGKVKPKTLSQTLKLVDMIRKSEELSFSEQVGFAFNIVSRAFGGISLIEQLRFVDSVSFKGSKWVRKFVETFRVDATATIGQFFRKLVTETLSLVGNVKKTFSKVLTPSYPYALWNGLLWAADGETKGTTDYTFKDAGANGTTHETTLHCFDDGQPAYMPAVGGVAGHFGNATSFSSAYDQWGEIEGSDEWADDFNDGFTVAVWLRRTSTADYAHMSRLRPGPNSIAWKFYQSASKPAFMVYDSSLSMYSTATWPSTMTSGIFYLVVMQYDGVSKVPRISVNGGAWVEGGALTNGLYIGTGPVLLCRSHDGATYRYESGVWDDVMLWNRCLSIDEVRELYDSPLGLNLNEMTDDKFSEGGGLSVVDTVSRWNLKFLEMAAETMSFVDTISRRTFNKIARETVQFVQSISILTALKSIKFGESIQFVTTALKTPFKRFRETTAVSASITRRSIAKRFVQTLSAVSDIVKRGFSKRMSQTVTASDRLAKSQRRSFAETMRFSDSIRKMVRKLSVESLTVIIGITKRTMRMVQRQTLWLFDVILPSGQKKLYARETLLFTSNVFKGFTKSTRETLAINATSLVGFIIRATITQTLKLVDGLRKTLTRRLRDTASFTDSVSKTVSLVRRQTFVLSDNMKKAGRKVIVQVSHVSDSIRKTFKRIIPQTMTLDDVVSTLHGSMLAKAVSETLVFVASMSKGAFRRLADSFKLQASFLRSTKVLALYETLTIILRQAKGLAKRLGPNQFYTLWDALSWAWDGENQLDSSRNSILNRLGLEPITSPPTIGGVAGHYGDATRLLGLTGADNGQYGIIATDPTGNSTSLISIAVWFKELTDDMGYIIAKGNTQHDSGDPFPWGLAKYPGLGDTLLAWNINGIANHVYSAPWTSDSDWHLAVCCYDKNEGKIKMSVDGGAYLTANYSSDISQNDVDITVARFYYAGDTPANLDAIEIDVDDVMFFRRTLTEAEVSALYNSRVGLNLNNYTSEKHTWGMPVSGSVTAQISALGMVLHEAVQLMDTIRKRAGITLTQNLSVVGNIVRRGFSKVIRQVISIPAIAHTYHSGYLTRYLFETVKFVTSLRKGESVHLHDVFTLYDWTRNTAGTITAKVLLETLRFVDGTSRRFGKVMTNGITFLAYPVKHFSKRLGPHHLYDIWGAVVEAFDMETPTTDYWRCESAAGTGVILTCAGTAPVTIGDATGKYGNATSFDSTELQYGAWTTTRTPGPQGSVMAWLKVSSTGLDGTVIARVHGFFPGYTLDWGISLDAGFPKFATTDKNGASASVTADNVISTNEFHLLVATWSASDGLIQLSVDGGAFKTAVLADELTALSGTCYVMGVFQYVNLSGVIDDPVIFSRSLAIAEVAALYQARKGLNLNDYTDDKAFWGTSVTDTVTRLYTRALSIEQAMVVVDSISKGMRRILSQTATLSDIVSKGLRRVIQQTAGFSESIKRSFDKVIVQSAKFEETFSRRFSYARAIVETFVLDDTLSWVQYKILFLQESLGLVDRWSRTHFAIRTFVERLKLTDVNISEVTFTILTVTPLAGTFPRPARIATLSLKVSTTAGAPLSNCAVTVAVQRPDGVSWKNLTLLESAYTPGIYSSNFTILGSDQLGSYPFVATARYGLLSVGTYNGFMTVFQGALAAIHFR